eukprot:scaffold80842_cov63-Phaeocystis_antarctica.AAC.1
MIGPARGLAQRRRPTKHMYMLKVLVISSHTRTSGDSVASDCCRSSARCAQRSRAADALLRVVECVGGGEEVEVSAAITRSERRARGGAERGARVRGTHDAGVARAVLTPPT